MSHWKQDPQEREVRLKIMRALHGRKASERHRRMISAGMKRWWAKRKALGNG